MMALWTMASMAALGLGISPVPEAANPASGTLIIQGGGKSSLALRTRALELAGGDRARILVLPQASNLADAGEVGARRWREIGAENVEVLDLADVAAATEAIRRADLIWMGGGDQVRLVNRLTAAGLDQEIVRRYHAGGVVGGTSAGASAMSRVMIARGGDDPGRDLANYPILGQGFGLWPEVIVDQHFLKLRRTPRLAHAVADHPDLIGVGIDETMAVIVSGRKFEVFGPGQVVVIDARAPAGTALKVAEAGGGDGPPPETGPAAPRVSTLDGGMTFDLDRGMIPEQVARTR